MPEYNARIELDSRDFDEFAVDVLTDVVDEFSGTVARAVHGGRVELLFTVPADTLRMAAITAMSVALTTGHQIYAAEVLPTDEFHRRIDAVRVPELVSVPEAAEMLAVSRQAVLAQVQSGKLPATKVGDTWAIPRAAVTTHGEQIARRFEGLAVPVGPVSTLGQVIDEDAIDVHRPALPVFNERNELVGVATARRENDGWHVHGRLRQFTPGEYGVVPQIEHEQVSYEGDLRRTTRGILSSVTVVSSTDREPTFPQARITVSDRRTHLDLSSLDLPKMVSYP